jgi:tetratricopeptide (TPR) repeat protein
MRFPVVFLLCCSLSALSIAEDKLLPKKGEKGVVPAKEDDWTGMVVIAKKPMKDIRFGDWVDGKQVFFKSINLMICKVREDRDGFLRVHDDMREGWVNKEDFCLRPDGVKLWMPGYVLYPEDPNTVFMRAVFFSELPEMRERALKDIESAILLDPKNELFFAFRGRLMMATKEYDKAITAFSECIRLNPTNSIALTYRGCAFIEKRELNKAIDDFTLAIIIGDKNPMAYSKRGYLRMVIAPGDSSKALADLNESIRLDSSSPEAFGIRGAILAPQKQYEKALADFDASLKLNSKQLNIIGMKAALHASMKQYTEAHIGTLTISRTVRVLMFWTRFER